MNDNVKLKLIKDTVINSILTEMHEKLLKNGVDEKKASELERVTKPRLLIILDSFDKRTLLPVQDLKSKEDFERHILRIIQLAKKKLESDILKETS
jgi:hypothetical protein